MIRFEVLRGRAAPLFEDNIDTDQLCPKQHLKAIRRIGFGAALFSDRRWEPDGTLREAFVLNKADYAEAKILIAGSNFGSGSSREHAVWALVDFGVRCVIASSFGDIFMQNTVNSGLLAIVLPASQVAGLASAAGRASPAEWVVDLHNQIITAPICGDVPFEIDPARKDRLLNGLDEIDLTLRHADEITDFKARQRIAEPWLWTDR